MKSLEKTGEIKQVTDATGVTGELGDGIDVSVSIDLNLRPESLRERLNELAEAVS